jgi:hypothetical protein
LATAPTKTNRDMGVEGISSLVADDRREDHAAVLGVRRADDKPEPAAELMAALAAEAEEEGG